MNMHHQSRRRALQLGGLVMVTSLSGCIGDVADRVPSQFPDEPPSKAVKTVKKHTYAVSQGNYVDACRDRCLLADSGGLIPMEGKQMSETEIREWAAGAEAWYADFSVSSLTVTQTEKMDSLAVGLAGYEAGYYITVEYEGEGTIANPFTEEVVKDDGEWFVLVAML